MHQWWWAVSRSQAWTCTWASWCGQQWLTSYSGHFRRAAWRRLVAGLQERFPWLKEYFAWNETQVALRCPVPYAAQTYRAQCQFFVRCLPGHAVVIQRGSHWELFAGPLHSLADFWARMGLLPARFHQDALMLAKRLLWDAAAPVAWIHQTERRIHGIFERVLGWRWTGAAT